MATTPADFHQLTYSQLLKRTWRNKQYFHYCMQWVVRICEFFASRYWATEVYRTQIEAIKTRLLFFQETSQLSQDTELFLQQLHIHKGVFLRAQWELWYEGKHQIADEITLRLHDNCATGFLLGWHLRYASPTDDTIPDLLPDKHISTSLPRQET